MKLTDTAFDDPRLDDLDAATVMLHFEALTYSNRAGLRGLIKRTTLRRVTRHPDPEVGAAALVAVGIWEVAEPGWQLVWLLGDQQTPEEAEAERAYAAVRQRLRFARARRDSPEVLAALREEEDAAREARNLAREERRSHSVMHTVTHSVNHSAPTRPHPKGGGTRSGGAGRPRTPPKAAAAPAPELSESLATTLARLGLAEQEVEDDRCVRCGVQVIWVEQLPEGIGWPNEITVLGPTEEQSGAFCPSCTAYSRSHQSREEEGKETCFALTREQAPCSQKALAGSLWCRYHQQARSRGVDPELGERRLAALREKARLMEASE